MDDRLWIDKKRKVEERKQRNLELRAKADKNQLFENIKTKLMTTMIGSLDAFEQNFGYLWGHEKPEEQLTEDELMFDELWDEVRSAILDKGHLQIKSVLKELQNYDVIWNGYSFNFKISGDE